jgi:hypothetical protein
MSDNGTSMDIGRIGSGVDALQGISMGKEPRKNQTRIIKDISVTRPHLLFVIVIAKYKMMGSQMGGPKGSGSTLSTLNVFHLAHE